MGMRHVRQSLFAEAQLENSQRNARAQRKVHEVSRGLHRQSCTMDTLAL